MSDPKTEAPPESHDAEPTKESHTRSILKALSWRIVATATTTLIAWIMTGQVATALSIGGIEFFAKVPVYYFHERAWQLVPRGAVRRIYGSHEPQD